jgi:hypothetical protein
MALAMPIHAVQAFDWFAIGMVPPRGMARGGDYMRVYFALVAVLSLICATPTLAQNCTQFGNSISCSNGLSAHQFGNTTTFSNGVTAHQFGNTTTYSDGVTANQFGNTTTFSDGKAAHQFGNTTSFSNGRTCRQFGNTISCN